MKLTLDMFLHLMEKEYAVIRPEGFDGGRPVERHVTGLELLCIETIRFSLTRRDTSLELGMQLIVIDTLTLIRELKCHSLSTSLSLVLS